jgi:hypothetical protein
LASCTLSPLVQQQIVTCSLESFLLERERGAAKLNGLSARVGVFGPPFSFCVPGRMLCFD